MAYLKDFNPTHYQQSQQIEKYLVDAVNQRRDLAGGMTYSLCGMWMRLHKDDHKSGGGADKRLARMALRMRNLMAEGDWFWKAAFIQSHVIKDGGDDIDGNYQKRSIEGQYRLTVLPVKEATKANIEIQFNKSHAYTVVTLCLPTGARTYVCTYKSSGKLFGLGSHLYVFDPNQGEFRIPHGKIWDFFSTLFKEYRANLDHTYMGGVDFK